jgi:hypothetical protein
LKNISIYVLTLYVKKRGAGSRPSWQRWPNGTIPYDMKPSICLDFIIHLFISINIFILADNHTELIMDAMRRMENLTSVDNVSCIEFRPKTDDDEIFITIQNGSGCSAHVCTIDQLET